MLSVTLGIPAGRALYSRLLFQLLAVLHDYRLFVFDLFVLFSGNNRCVCGLRSAGILLGRPAFHLASQHNGRLSFVPNKFQTLGIIFSASILSAFPFVAFLRESPALVVIVSSLFMIFASVFLLDKPVI